MRYTCLHSPIGELLIAGDAAGIRHIGFPSGRQAVTPGSGWTEDSESLAPARDQLAAWLAGEITEFDLPLAPRVTPFQGRVLDELRKIPYGATISYGELACRVGKPGAARAVGMANARNPIPIVIPCHRVIGANGKLTGFGGGIETKRWLLALEARNRGGLLHSLAQGA